MQIRLCMRSLAQPVVTEAMQVGSRNQIHTQRPDPTKVLCILFLKNKLKESYTYKKKYNTNAKINI